MLVQGDTGSSDHGSFAFERSIRQLRPGMPWGGPHYFGGVAGPV